MNVCGQGRERETAYVCVHVHTCMRTSDFVFVCLVAVPHFLHLRIVPNEALGKLSRACGSPKLPLFQLYFKAVVFKAVKPLNWQGW